MKLFRIACLVAVALALLRNVSGQSFVNLNFESAQVSGYAQGTYIPFTNALPGWNGYAISQNSGKQLITQAYFNATQPLIGLPPQISLQTSNVTSVAPGFLPIQGNYSVLLQAALPGQSNAAIGQTGEIPTNAQTMTFLGAFEGQITFGGQPILYSAIQNFTNYMLFAATISQFAGQTGELLFETSDTPESAMIGTLDDIQFSSSPVPEPSALSLFSICILFLCWRMKRFSSKFVVRQNGWFGS